MKLNLVRFIEQPPLLYRLLFPEALWRIKRKRHKVAYLTFDDGPIPQVTPWVLDVLDSYGVKATFFMVGDNVRRYPHLLDEVRSRGHSVGNHTMHHVQGFKMRSKGYIADIAMADELIDSPLFRPPHGIIRWSQARAIKARYNLVMYDLITRDYNRYISHHRVLDNVKNYVRDGSIIVFHDSLKAQRNMQAVLPSAIQWLKDQGYELLPIPM